MVLTEIYIEALVVDEQLADQVWAAWHTGEADDETALMAWLLICLTTIAPTTTILVENEEE